MNHEFYELHESQNAITGRHSIVATALADFLSPQGCKKLAHKWGVEHLPLNAMLWSQISTRCSLLIDQPEPTSDGPCPYYVSRLEFLMRHADVLIRYLPDGWGHILRGFVIK